MNHSRRSFLSKLLSAAPILLMGSLPALAAPKKKGRVRIVYGDPHGPSTTLFIAPQGKGTARVIYQSPDRLDPKLHLGPHNQWPIGIPFKRGGVS